MGGVSSARGQNSSFDEVAVVICLGAVHMEEEVQDRVQVEVGREEQGVGETHGKEQGEEQRDKEQTLNQPHNIGDHEYNVMRTNTFLSHDVSVQSLCMRTVQEKNDVRGVPVHSFHHVCQVAVHC